MRAPHILIACANSKSATILRKDLEHDGFAVTVASDGFEAVTLAREKEVDLMVVDLSVPQPDGLNVIRTLRREGLHLPILSRASKSDVPTTVESLRTGADDCVAEAVEPPELLARVDALLRRVRNGGSPALAAFAGGGASHEGPFRFGGIEVDPAARTVRRERATVDLTPKEFDLLVALLRRGGAVATRPELLHEVWRHRAPVPSRTVDTHIASLRRKLERDPASPDHIFTVWKVGYRLRRGVRT